MKKIKQKHILFFFLSIIIIIFIIELIPFLHELFLSPPGKYKICLIIVGIIMSLIFFKFLLKIYKKIFLLYSKKSIQLINFLKRCTVMLIRFLNTGNRWILFLFIIHIILVNHFFPLIEVFNKNPIVDDDYPLFYYQTNTLKQLYMQGRISGFNLHFTEGNVSPFIWDKIGAMVELIFFFVPSLIVFKSYIYFFFLLFPFIVYLIAKNFSFPKSVRVVSFLLAMIIFNFHRLIKDILYSGQYPFLFSSIVAILSISYFYLFIIKNKYKYLLIGGILFLISFFLHLSILLVYIFPFSYLLYIFFKKSKRKLLIIILFSISLLFVLLIILRQFILYVTYVSSDTLFYSAGFFSIFWDLITSPIQTIILASGIIGLVFFNKTKKSSSMNFSNFMLFTIISYFLIIYSGSYFPIVMTLKTYRLMIPLTIILIPFSALSLLNLCNSFVNNKKQIVGIFGLFFFFIFYLGFNTYQTISNELFINMDRSLRKELNLPLNSDFDLNMRGNLDFLYHKKISTEIPKNVQSLITWISLYTDNNARILIEDSGTETSHKYGGHLTGLFSEWSNRLFFNFPGTYILLRNDIKIASFWNKTMLGHTIYEYNERDFNEIFNTYNIKWIIAFSNESNRIFQSYPLLINKIIQIGNFTIYETNIHPNFFITGNGSIDVYNFNLLHITNVSHGDLILKFPYNPNCISKPSLEIKRKDYKFTQSLNGFMYIPNNSYANINITC